MTTKPIYTDSQILGGTPVFTGTLVPVQSLFNYIENGGKLTFLYDETISFAIKIQF